MEIPSTPITTTYPSGTSSTTTSNATSKIPHPLASLLAGKTNQFRRSASLRLRGAKSNLLFSTQRNINSGIDNPQNAMMGTLKETNTKTTLTSVCNDNGTERTNLHSQDSQTSVHIIHDRNNFCGDDDDVFSAISSRRKVFLDASSSTSLRSVLFNNTSSDSKLKQGSTVALNEKEFLEHVSRNKEVLEKHSDVVKSSSKSLISDFKSNSPERTLKFKQLLANGNIQAKSTMDENLPSTMLQPAATTTTKKRDTNKMSLNLNGPTRTTTHFEVKNSTVTTATNTSPITARTPKTPNHYQQYNKQPLETVPESKPIPKTPPVTPDSPSTYLEDDIDSLYSFATTTSGRSTMSCDHPYVARNGTTFSGRKMKYVVHCSNYAGQVGEDYLTPTQRAQRQIRRLKDLLCNARQDLEQKDSELLRLTREVVELRLFKASLSSPEDPSNSSDAVTVREADLKTSQDVSPIVDMIDDSHKASPRQFTSGNDQHDHIQIHHHHLHHSTQLLSEMQSSFADSGHFEDMTTSSVHSKDSSYVAHTNDIACGSDEASGSGEIDHYKEQRQELIQMYEQRIEELIKTQDSVASDVKRSHNDKVEALLQKLAEINTRYADIVPDYEHAKERIRELEKSLEELQRKLAEHEEKQNKMYLHMYQKGQEAERIARTDRALELAHRTPNKVSINELLHQLQTTQDELENIRAAECRKQCSSNHALLTAKEAISLWVLGARKTIYRRLLDAQKNKTHVDPEITLQFLKSAVYYFLTDKENSQGHLQAIESILEFTDAEKQDIHKARANK